MLHLLRVPGGTPERELGTDYNAERVVNIATDRTEALRLGKQMAMHHKGLIHVYELVKILSPVTTVEVNDPPADARPRERHEGGVTLEEKQALCGNE